MQKFFAIAQDFSGNIVPNATITVYNAGTLNLAPIFSDNGVMPKLNPFISDDDGTFEYYAANGRYDTLVVKAGFTFDPANTADCLLDDPSASLAYGAVRLIDVSATQLKLVPYNGLLLSVPNADGTNLRTRTIPGTGILMANTNVMVNQVAGQNLAANVTYFVYIRDNGSGTLIPNFSTTGHVTSSITGVEQRIGGAMDVLVGMARTNASSQFVDTPEQRFVLSWFNRQLLAFVKQMAPANLTSGSVVYFELSPSTDRAEFLVWADGQGTILVSGSVGNDTQGSHTLLEATVDGVASIAAPGSAGNFQNTAGGAPDDVSVVGFILMGEMGGLTEGYHYAAPFGRVNGNTGTWFGGAFESRVYTRGWIMG